MIDPALGEIHEPHTRIGDAGHDLIGLIGAMIGDNVHVEKLARVMELFDAFKKSPDHKLFLVRGDQDRESRGRGAPSSCLPRPRPIISDQASGGTFWPPVR